MRSLEKTAGPAASSEVLAAMCHLLSLVLGRVPNSVLRAKFGAGAALLRGVMEAKRVRRAGRGVPVEMGSEGDGCCSGRCVTTRTVVGPLT